MKEIDKEILKYYEESYKSIDGNFINNYTEIVSKHKTLLENTLKKISEGKELFLNDFRSSEEQDDLGFPPQISLEHMKYLGFHRSLKNYFFKMFTNLYGSEFKRSFLDDIAILEKIGAKKLMKENPVHLTPNCSDFYQYKNTTLNLRWIRYLYFAQRILDSDLLKENSTWVDIGSYYGGLQSLIYKNKTNLKIILVDFKSQLCKSYIFLKRLFPNSNHILPDKILNTDLFSKDLKSCFAYLPAEKFHYFKFQKIDLMTNFFSFGEMKRDTFNKYFSHDFLSKVDKIYLANRFVSSPHFEKTYDSDLCVLDYSSKMHKLKYFDILPIHYYFLNKRTINGINAFRPLSSPYFEMIYER